MDGNAIIQNALSLPNDAIRRAIAIGIRDAAPELELAEVGALYGTCYRFATKGFCTFEMIDEFKQDFELHVYDERVTGSPKVVWLKIQWQGQVLEYLEVELLDGFHRRPHGLLMSNSREAIDKFLLALDRFANDVDGAVLVFQEGCWSYSEELFADIKTSTFENLVLPVGMAEQIKNDVQSWLDSKELYEQHGIPWKRGMILVGPPGNGKTHMIKSLVNHFALNALYVRGFSAEYKTDSENISAVFRKARACAPAILILEDLDSLVNPTNRSHFLNELDGFALNSGILTVASANDPEKLDPALINRPSRFDRRYVFSMPTAVDRSRYLQFFTSSLDSTLQLGDEDSTIVGEATEGFSYAYLKELVLSSMIAWISSGRTEPFRDVVLSHVAPLLNQMSGDVDEAASEASSDPGRTADQIAYAQAMMRRRGKLR